jgi:hypothetical protein
MTFRQLRASFLGQLSPRATLPQQGRGIVPPRTSFASIFSITDCILSHDSRISSSSSRTRRLWPCSLQAISPSSRRGQQTWPALMARPETMRTGAFHGVHHVVGFRHLSESTAASTSPRDSMMVYLGCPLTADRHQGPLGEAYAPAHRGPMSRLEASLLPHPLSSVVRLPFTCVFS